MNQNQSKLGDQLDVNVMVFIIVRNLSSTFMYVEDGNKYANRPHVLADLLIYM
jgi:hypothetical protein